MNRLATIIWGLVLIVSYLLALPVLLTLLRGALDAARQIEEYSAEILNHGGGIAQNTAHVAALKDTIAVAPRLVAAADSLERHTASIETALGTTGDGHITGGEASA